MQVRSQHTVLLIWVFLYTLAGDIQAQTASGSMPEISSTAKPWTRWWWMGNAVDKSGIKQNLLAFQKAGLGGVEITPIYGVIGEEENYLDFLSPPWMEMLDYTIGTADSLGLQVDVTLGTGWPYGGPQVTLENAATRLIVDKERLLKGERIQQEIVVQGETDKETAVLKYILAFGDDGSYVDLTDRLQGNRLNWKAKGTDDTLYKVFTGKTGQQVKRAAPGGKGYTMDHYSIKALNAYLVPFDTAFANLEKRPRAVFNDSYEVYGTDFTPDFFTAFREKRGYDLKPHMDLLLSTTDTGEGNRVKSDYRETLADLLLLQFAEPWTGWANERGLKTRLQAHGSPGNLIDLYASSDIPECETFGSMPYDIQGLRREREDIREGDADPVMLKFSSSAAHISGKPLTSSETFTWLRDHFKTALSQCKPEAEDLLLSGVNHIFLHGSTYSPERATWPGWKFYASVNFNPNNTVWKDAPSLFSYISNCQALLQSGKPDNEVLLYWPVYDIWDDYLKGTLFLQYNIHSLDEWLHGTNFYNTATKLLKEGYGVDFISDLFIQKARVDGGNIQLPGGSYKSLVIPDSDKMPMATLQKLIQLRKQGAQIIFEGLPESVPGFHAYKEKNRVLQNLIQENREILEPVMPCITVLNDSGVYPEKLVQTGLKFIRRDISDYKVYYLVNHTAKEVNEYIPLQTEAEEVFIYDPLTHKQGKAAIKRDGNTTLVKVYIPSGMSIFLRTGDESDFPNWDYYEKRGNPVQIKGKWKLSFLNGGPELPESETLTRLTSWTALGNDARNFSGTAQYEIEFEGPGIEADQWKLNLGDVRESARVWLNGEYLGTAWSVPFTLNTGPLKEKNQLVIQVTNLAANRIRAKEIRGEEWKIFHEINMVNKDYQEFDASVWNPMPSGLLGAISLTPLKRANNP
ncbi:MAG TPA: glycosyl hydrolase [Eudoraea sp.]|nr:glycosyl hydrolase [Eudoraea sp.]